MKKIAAAFLICLSVFQTKAQDIPAFKNLRYEEDYSFLQKDSLTNWYYGAKFHPFNASRRTYISFGGDVRLQYFNVTNPVWGDEPKDADGYVFSRYLLHADFHAGKIFRTFVQLQSSMANGKLNASPVDEDPLDLHQAFADIRLQKAEDRSITFRIGRQEMLYGSQRIVALRDGPNNRQSFDGFKTIIQSGTYRLDLFYTRPVASAKGIFDDKHDKNTKFWGSYLMTGKWLLSQSLDVYYLGIEKARAVFDDGAAKELRHSLGVRIWSTSKRWRNDIEAIYQFGDFGSKKISAWTASLNTGYRLGTSKNSAEAGLKVEAIRGDRQTGDAQLNTFNPLFPRGAYFGYAAIIGPANLFDVHPSLSFPLAKGLLLDADADFFWRYSNADGIYGPNAALIYTNKGVDEKKIGEQYSTDVIYTPNNFLYFRSEFTWFKSGPYLKQASSGKDILFAGMTIQLKF
jgi:hypothetical protein